MGIISKISSAIKKAITPKPLIDPMVRSRNLTPMQALPESEVIGTTFDRKGNIISRAPTNTPTPAQNMGTKPFNDFIVKIWADKTSDADRILAGENARRKVGLDMDIANRINPQTGKWDNNAPVMLRKHPITGKMIASIDRGLFRIKNITFYYYFKRKPALLKKNGITKGDDMLDPEKNTKKSNFFYPKQSPINRGDHLTRYRMFAEHDWSVVVPLPRLRIYSVCNVHIQTNFPPGVFTSQYSVGIRSLICPNLDDEIIKRFGSHVLSRGGCVGGGPRDYISLTVKRGTNNLAFGKGLHWG